MPRHGSGIFASGFQSAAAPAGGGGIDFDASAYGTVLTEFDFSDTGTITESGGAVSAVAQKSGSLGLTVVQGTGSARPTTGTVSLNGFNVLDFDGGDLLAVDVNPDEAQPVTLAVVARTDTTSGDAHFLGNHTSLQPTIFYAGGNYAYYAGQTRSASGPTLDTNWHVFVARFLSGDNAYYIDGSLRSTESPGNTNPLRSIAIGAASDLSSPLNGAVAHAIYFDGGITNANIVTLSGALNTAWGGVY